MDLGSWFSPQRRVAFGIYSFSLCRAKAPPRGGCTTSVDQGKVLETNLKASCMDPLEFIISFTIRPLPSIIPVTTELLIKTVMKESPSTPTPN